MTVETFFDAAIRNQSLLLPLIFGVAFIPSIVIFAPAIRDILINSIAKTIALHVGHKSYDYEERGPTGAMATFTLDVLRLRVEERPKGRWALFFLWLYKSAVSLTRTKFAVITLMLAITFVGISYFFGLKYVDPAVGLPLPRSTCQTPRPEAKGAIVFIHGWNGAGDATWQNFPRLACDDPNLSWAQIYVVDYPTYMVNRNLSVPELSEWLEKRFFSAKIYPNFGDVYIIAHSMGGLISRRLYLLDRLSGAPSSIRAIVSIASPYQGALIGSLASALHISDQLTADMDPHSSFLGQLDGDWRRVPIASRPVTYCMTSPQDAIVTEWSAISQCACTYKYPQWGHVDMVKPADRDDERYEEPIRALELVLAARRKATEPQCF